MPPSKGTPETSTPAQSTSSSPLSLMSFQITLMDPTLVVGRRSPLVSKCIGSTGEHLFLQLTEFPLRVEAYRLVIIPEQASGRRVKVAFLPVTHICGNGTRALVAIPQCCVCVFEPTAPSMSHFTTLSLSASRHPLTLAIIMLIYIV